MRKLAPITLLCAKRVCDGHLINMLFAGCGKLQLHPLQQEAQATDASLQGCHISADACVTPSRCAAVFVETR